MSPPIETNVLLGKGEKVTQIPYGKAAPANKKDFTWATKLEPHAERAKKILKAHPEIKKLFGPEPRTALITLALVATQIWISSWIGQCGWVSYFLIMYIFGATMNHSLQLANHELSHNLAFDGRFWNYIFGIIANFPTAVPSSVPFRGYHMEHHQKQGMDGVDSDIPTDWELRTFRGPFLKVVWLFCQVFAYAIRPMFVKPLPISKWQIFNLVAQMAFNYWAYTKFGWSAIIYYLMCDLFGLGLHPTAGHFIAEHYEYVSGYETYSYIGPINYVNFNVGYHIAHHDFPRIPWSRIWKVREFAPEWYNYPVHDSYLKVLYNYVFDDNLGAFARIKRKNPKKSK